MFLTALLLVTGISLLAIASDHLVRGAASLATLLGLSPIVVGVVVIVFGTSSPELLVSVLAAVDGSTDAAVGNVVGSNLANLSLLVGVAALLTPLSVGPTAWRREIPIALAAAITLPVLLLGGLGLVDGVVALAAMAAVLVVLLRSGQAVAGLDPADEGRPTGTGGSSVSRRWFGPALHTIGGLAGVLGGAHLLVAAATSAAREFGVSDAVIGATVLAVGTSLPELVTVVQSARRREVELIVGNLLGSNLFNGLAVLGTIAMLGGGAVAPLVVSIAIAAAVLTGIAVVALSTGGRLERWEGLALIGFYAAVVVTIN